MLAIVQLSAAAGAHHGGSRKALHALPALHYGLLCLGAAQTGLQLHASDVHLHSQAACLCVLIRGCAVQRQADLAGPMPPCSTHGSWQHSPCVPVPAAFLLCLHVIFVAHCGLALPLLSFRLASYSCPCDWRIRQAIVHCCALQSLPASLPASQVAAWSFLQIGRLGAPLHPLRAHTQPGQAEAELPGLHSEEWAGHRHG